MTIHGRYTAPKTPHQTKQNHLRSDVNKDFARNIRRVMGRIAILDPAGTGRLVCTVQVVDRHGTHQFGGGTGVPMVIIDDPLDILHRFGSVVEGMRVEVFYTGQVESPQAYARIIGPAVENPNGLEQEETTVFNAPSLPFEPSF